MKLLITVALVLGICATAVADRPSKARHKFKDFGRVVDVTPIYETVSFQKPKRECWTEEQRYLIREHGQSSYRDRRSSSTGDVLIGTVIGGVIGNQLGRKGSDSARAGATVAGAIIGSALAGESSSRGTRHRRGSNSRYERHNPSPKYETRPVERCKNTTETHYEEQLQGYDVTYRYKGKRFTTRMNQDPCNRIELQISVKPIV